MGFITSGRSDRRRKRRKIDSLGSIKGTIAKGYDGAAPFDQLPMEVLESIFFYSVNDNFPLVNRRVHRGLSVASKARTLHFIAHLKAELGVKKYLKNALDRRFFTMETLRALESRLALSFNLEMQSLPVRLLRGGPDFLQNLRLLQALKERGACPAAVTCVDKFGPLLETHQRASEMLRFLLAQRLISATYATLYKSVLLGDLPLCKELIAAGVQADANIIKLACQKRMDHLVFYFLHIGTKFDINTANELAVHV